MNLATRCLGFVVFRLMRDERGEILLRDGEYTTTRRQYLAPSGAWVWDPGKAARFGEDEWVDDGKGGIIFAADKARADAAAACGEECYRAMLFPSRQSEREAAEVRRDEEPRRRSRSL